MFRLFFPFELCYNFMLELHLVREATTISMRLVFPMLGGKFIYYSYYIHFNLGHSIIV